MEIWKQRVVFVWQKDDENSLEDGYEQVEQQYVGKKQVNTEHDDGEPLREGWCLTFI